jgi:peptidoglycan/LPS O-acetylase OafA/YrhL
MISDGARPSQGRIPVLDGWRGFAILVVVIHNAGVLLWHLHPGAHPSVAIAHTVLDAGWVGVQLFFVLSGFLITGILLDDLGSPKFFRDFYIRRSLRIFPLYFAFLFLALIVVPTLGLDPSVAQEAEADGLWYWLYLANWKPLLELDNGPLRHLWSLAVEEQFYLVWPLLVYSSGVRRFRWIAAGVVAGSIVSRAFMYEWGPDSTYLYYFTNARADSLALGALMAIALRTPSWREALDRWQIPALASVTIVLALVVALDRGFHQFAPRTMLLAQTVISAWFGLLMWASMRTQTGYARTLQSLAQSRTLRVLGKYSYAI